MKARSGRVRVAQQPGNDARVEMVDVHKHARLTRRGSTAVAEEGRSMRRGSNDPPRDAG
jgi:hypothetical protein